MELEIKTIEEAMNDTYPGIVLYVRNASLGDTEEMYTKGIILKEKAFVDATMRVGGMMTTHRFSILSNHMVYLGDFEHGTNWGLCIAQNDSYFKVLDVFKYKDKMQILLLHLPARGWKAFKIVNANIDDEIIKKMKEKFRSTRNMKPYKELTTEVWLDRCSFPIGINDVGLYFKL